MDFEMLNKKYALISIVAITFKFSIKQCMWEGYREADPNLLKKYKWIKFDKKV